MFSIAEAFRFARKAYRVDFCRLSGLAAVMLLSWVLLEILVALGHEALGSAYNVGLHLIYLWATCLPEATLVQVCLDRLEGRESRFRQTLRDVPLSLNYLAAKALFWLVVGVGLLVGVIPGIYFAIRYQFVVYFIVERRCGPIEAFRLSSQVTRGARWQILSFEALIVLLHGLGASLLGVGVLITIPVAALATAHVFRSLTRSASQPEPLPL